VHGKGEFPVVQVFPKVPGSLEAPVFLGEKRVSRVPLDSQGEVSFLGEGVQNAPQLRSNPGLLFLGGSGSYEKSDSQGAGGFPQKNVPEKSPMFFFGVSRQKFRAHQAFHLAVDFVERRGENAAFPHSYQSMAPLSVKTRDGSLSGELGLYGKGRLIAVSPGLGTCHAGRRFLQGLQFA